MKKKANKTDNVPTPKGEIDWVARLNAIPGELRLSEPERTALFKAVEEGVTDWNERLRRMEDARYVPSGLQSKPRPR